MWYAPVGRFTMKEEGDWLPSLRTEDGTEQDVLRRPGEVRGRSGRRGPYRPSSGL